MSEVKGGEVSEVKVSEVKVSEAMVRCVRHRYVTVVSTRPLPLGFHRPRD
jgi:hypothetical protein